MSLRIKYLLASAGSVLVPLLAYLLLDTLLIRSILLEQHAESLRQVADLIHSSLDSCDKDCKRGPRKLLGRFARAHPDLEVMILDADSVVFAASRPELVGEHWHEEGIETVLAGHSAFHWARMDHHGVPVLDVTIPWRDASAKVRGAIHLARILSSVEEHITGVQIRHTVFVVVVALLVGTFLSLVTYRLVIRRLTRLDHELHAGRWTAGTPELSVRGDEIEHVSAALRSLVVSLTETAGELEKAVEEKGSLLDRVERFNEELEREVQKTREELLAAQRELVRAEHLSTIGQLAAGLAHELRNPLFIVRASAEKWARKNPETEELAADIIEEVDRVEAIIAGLLDLGRPLDLEEKAVDLDRVLEEAAAQVARAQPAEKTIEWKVECSGNCRTRGDFGLLRQAFTNILSNACDAIERQGQVRVRAGPDAEGKALVEIRDTGSGIAAEDLPRVFKPFFTRKASGTGLGLAASEKILNLHGAEVSMDSEPGSGTRVTVRLPAIGSSC